MIKIKLHPFGIYKTVKKGDPILSYTFNDLEKNRGKEVLINDWYEGYVFGELSQVNYTDFSLKIPSKKIREYQIHDLEELLFKISLKNLFRKKIIN